MNANTRPLASLLLERLPLHPSHKHHHNFPTASVSPREGSAVQDCATSSPSRLSPSTDIDLPARNPANGKVNPVIRDIPYRHSSFALLPPTSSLRTTICHIVARNTLLRDSITINAKPPFRPNLAPPSTLDGSNNFAVWLGPCTKPHQHLTQQRGLSQLRL